MSQRLRTSPNFALSHAADGRSFAIGETEPYPQYWLTRQERLLFALFGARGGMTIDGAVEALAALAESPLATSARARIARTIATMREAGLLIAPDGELSRYGRSMARHYLDHRPFPATIATRIAELGQIGGESRVLDLAAGPGSLALELATRTPHVAMMELSRGFVAAARDEAKRRSLLLTTIHESCNRLVQVDDSFDVMTISQAIHWLDDVALVKGICRNLAAGGSFFVIHASLTLPPGHPLDYILGDRTPLGDKAEGSFAEQVRRLYHRLATLFEALDSPDVARHDPGHARQRGGAIVGTRIELFDQQRPIGEGFARAFLSDAHIAALDQSPRGFWADLKRRCDPAGAAALTGSQSFALLHFKRGAQKLASADWMPDAPREIGFPG
jgi:SAM-dependent methyltransferase